MARVGKRQRGPIVHLALEGSGRLKKRKRQQAHQPAVFAVVDNGTYQTDPQLFALLVVLRLSQTPVVEFVPPWEKSLPHKVGVNLVPPAIEDIARRTLHPSKLIVEPRA